MQMSMIALSIHEKKNKLTDAQNYFIRLIQ